MSFKIGTKVYVPYWDIKESRDFQGKKDEEHGVKTVAYPREGRIYSKKIGSYVVEFKGGDKVTVKSDMVNRYEQGCRRFISQSGIQ